MSYRIISKTIRNAPLLVLIISLLIRNAWATPKYIQVYIVHVAGKNGVSRERARELFSEAAKIYQTELKIELRVKQFVSRGNPFGGRYSTLDISDRRNLLRLWEGWFKRYRDKDDLKLAILPPIYEQNVYWIAGIANGICSRGRINPVAYANATEEDSLGHYRTKQGIVALSHELAHELGATHIDAYPNIMHSAALSFVREYELHFADDSKVEIEACIK